MKKLILVFILICPSRVALADFDAGLDAFARGDYAAAVREFRPSAEQGEALAQYHLGEMYSQGKGVDQDYSQALIWYLKAADQGSADAEYRLGMMYYRGEGVAQDNGAAERWFRKAAAQGSADAQSMLKIIHPEETGANPLLQASREAPSPEPALPQAAAPAYSDELVRAAADFRAAMMRDYQGAVSVFSPRFAHQSFYLWDQKLWTDIDPYWGWSYFIGTAVPMVGAGRSGKPIVVFYHPWSDTALLTQWDLTLVPPQFIDAELFSGEYLRGLSARDQRLLPYWLRETPVRPAALARSVDAVRAAVERTFPPFFSASFRTAVDSGAAGEFGLLLVRSAVTAAVMQVSALRTGRDYDNAPFASLRKTYGAISADLGRGDVWRVLQAAAESDAASVSAVKALRPIRFADLAAAAALFQSGGGLIFAVPVDNSDFALAFSLEFMGSKLKLRRLACYNFIQGNSFADEVFGLHGIPAKQIAWVTPARRIAAERNPGKAELTARLKGGGVFGLRLEEAYACGRRYDFPMVLDGWTADALQRRLVGEAPWDLDAPAAATAIPPA